MFVLKQKPQHNKDDSWWIAPWSGGDPSRTLKVENAKRYSTAQNARIARGYFTNRYSHIRKIDLEVVEIEK
jgi:hypothetical protein